MIEGVEKVKNGVISRVLDMLFPVQCVNCGAEGKYVCEKCWVFVGEAALICPVCMQSSFLGERHAQCASRYGLDGLVGMWEYEGVIRKVVLQAKYRNIQHAFSQMTQEAFAGMIREKDRFALFLEFIGAGDAIIVYIPMHKKKERKRGFNQAEIIAREVSKITRQEMVSLLEKIIDTLPQAKLDKKQRLNNVKDSFVVNTKQNVLQGMKVILVDDVWTTGATMKECCRVLKKAGAQKVWGFILARTV